MMNHGLSLSIYFFASYAQAEIDFTKPVICHYQFGQTLEPDKAHKGKNNSTPMVWKFFGLNSDNPYFESDGDKDTVFARKIPLGVLIFSPFLTGAHIFTVYSNGHSFWSKQASIRYDLLYAQQHRGTCSN